MRLATGVAAGLGTAALVMAALAFTTGGDGAEQAAPAPAVRANGGLAVWTAQGCGSCHTLAVANAHAEVGPDLAASLKGKPASYIRQSIVDPRAHAAPGYSTGIMPEDYATRIAAGDLDRLVAFLHASAR
jgi:mono/diheme cytochrome c family protein